MGRQERDQQHRCGDCERVRDLRASAGARRATTIPAMTGSSTDVATTLAVTLKGTSTRSPNTLPISAIPAGTTTMAASAATTSRPRTKRADPPA